MLLAVSDMVNTLRFPSVVAALCWGVLVCVPSLHGQSAGSVGLTLTVGPECAVAITSQAQGSAGGNVTQTVTFSYLLRTSASAGEGQILLRFLDTGLGNSPVAYQTQIAGPGVAVSGTAAASDGVRSGIAIARFGPQMSSSRVGATGTVQLTVGAAPVQPMLSISCL
jgi:hypothetical protein